ncbi:cell division protein ZapA [Candidatus Contubernalis alkaliaceticus]|uniref:cell division protein ZapA n=1 Tax=Candidatus Contubernalis alkaliaceticus TaxID=338645 RepID=UPI001F4C26BA|nr:cell division protein ZapA [Candidatus Contubernalis alkalaceticus]UNC92643.1 cell division protein ZapA [Candidatus Contubernalis alkalaceticus]
MSENKNKVKVNIYGEDYTIRSSLPVNYMKRLADYVNSKMNEVSGSSTSGIGMHKIAILAALNLSDEIYNLKREVKKLNNKLEEKNIKPGDLE